MYGKLHYLNYKPSLGIILADIGSNYDYVNGGNNNSNNNDKKKKKKK